MRGVDGEVLITENGSDHRFLRVRALLLSSSTKKKHGEHSRNFVHRLIFIIICGVKI